MVYTSIQIKPETRLKLAALKTYPRETYDDLLNQLMKLVPSGDEEGEYTGDFRAGLLRAKLELTQGKTLSHEQVKKSLGL